MPRIYTAVRRPVTQRKVNPLVLPEAPKPDPVPEPKPNPVPDEDMSTLSLAALKGLAEDKGVASYGTKADIIARLTDD